MATTAPNLPSPEQERPIGFGRLKRKEDARFIRGKGTYLDDIRLPGMVHGAILRSPYAHARIVSIDTSEALALPGVAAVVTAKDLETLGLAWMPTISYDTQAVLAGDKVRFQGQEVAFVVAADAVDHDVRLRFFNSRKEAPFVGHATVAAHAVLLALGRRAPGVCRQHCGVGIVEVSAQVEQRASGAETVIEFRQTAPELEPRAPRR